MKYAVFAIYDTKAAAYLQPFFSQTKATALRSFSDLVNDRNHSFFKHAGDFVLFEIGTYDDQTALLQPVEANLSLGNGLELQQPTEVPALEAIQ